MASSPISEPFTLQSGLVLQNRLIKTATAENLGDKKYLPTEALVEAYETWANGGWGMVITGTRCLPQFTRSETDDSPLLTDLGRQCAS
jgi:2,4-dienoyl-CoA reductase-like NADH-dependent reductase (Old Yellow Enzyme family)